MLIDFRAWLDPPGKATDPNIENPSRLDLLSRGLVNNETAGVQELSNHPCELLVHLIRRALNYPSL